MKQIDTALGALQKSYAPPKAYFYVRFDNYLILDKVRR